MKSKMLLGVFGLFILSSCAAPQIPKFQETLSLQDHKPVQAPQKTVESTETKAPELKAAAPAKVYSLGVKNADIKDIILLISKESGVTITSDKEVEGKVTIDAKDKTLKEILHAILKPIGFTFFYDEGVIRVGKPRLVTGVFPVNYIKDKRTSSSMMNAAISTTGTTGYTPSGSGIATGGTGSPTSTGSTGGQQGSVSVTTSGTSDFWNEIIKGVEVIVFGGAGTGQRHEGGYSRGEKSGKKLIVNELAGLIYVTDYSDNMDNVKILLEEIEKSVKRQVLIQAHIMEVSLNDSFTFGVDWNLLLGSGTGTSGQLLGVSQSLAPTPPSKVFQLNLTEKKFSGLLDAMREQGQLNMLSSPKISTLNNQRAVIKLTTKEVSWITNTAFSSDGKVFLQYTTPQVDEVGIFLDVTPQISEDGMITMQIHPSISEKTKLSYSPPGVSGVSSKPIIDSREVDTIITVRDGQTIVIAGLIVDKIIETKRSVPFLSDIPVIGNAFKYLSYEKKKVELVILLTPYILNEKVVDDVKKHHEKRMNDSLRDFQQIPAVKEETKK